VAIGLVVGVLLFEYLDSLYSIGRKAETVSLIAVTLMAWLGYTGMRRHLYAEMWRQASSYAREFCWYLTDVTPVIDPATKRRFLLVTLCPGTLSSRYELTKSYVPIEHPDAELLAQWVEDDVEMRIPVRLNCIAPDINSPSHPEFVFDLLRISLA